MENFTASTLIFLLICCSDPVNSDGTIIKFKNAEHDFGSIAFRKPSEYLFEFTNVGNNELRIDKVTTLCEQTKVEYSEKVIPAGKNGLIKVVYAAASPGTFYKKVQIHYNGKGSPAILTIKGLVEFPYDVHAAEIK